MGAPPDRYAQNTTMLPFAPVTGRAAAPGALGRVPVVAALVALGLLVCAFAENLSRSTPSPSPWIYWAGMAILVAPIIFRLTAGDASANERLALVCILGLSLYLVKLMRDPFGFTLSDEFSHAFNVQQILHHHHLFSANPLLPVTADYPGLEGATAAVASLTGMTSFGAGILVVGAARLTLMIALFALFAGITRSSRVAGLGAAIYAGNSNFVLWNAQFAYESLALPLLVVVIACLVERRDELESNRRSWGIAITLVIAAIVPTHHLTSYLLVVLLLVLAASTRLPRWFSPMPGVWKFGLIAIGLTALWLSVVASVTVGYISPVVTAALQSTIKTISGEVPPHALFSNSGVAGGVANDLGEKAVGIAATVILFVALPSGLLVIWRGYRREVFPALLGLGAVGYFGVTGLRFAPSAWEIANRTAEFLFIGVAFVVAQAPLRRLALRGRPSAGRGLVALCGAIIVVGGAITGWPANSRTAQPLVVAAADGARIRSEPLAVGRFFAGLPNDTIVAPESDAFMIALYGSKTDVRTGRYSSADEILTAHALHDWQLALWRRDHIRYVVVDLRQRGTDNVTGFYFSLRSAGGVSDPPLPATTASRFDRLGAPRLYDSGDVLVYDLQGVP